MKVKNSLGLVFDVSERGAVRSIVVDGIRIGLRPFCVNVYLRKRGNELVYTPLLGADSPSRFHVAENGFEARGAWQGVEYVCGLQLSAAAHSWQWQVSVQSELEQPIELDLIYVQDVGLQADNDGLVNEQYVSQYLERRVFDDAQHGAVVACRQNMKAGKGQHPWLMLACAGRASSASTDGLQFFGRTFRATGEPEALRAPALAGELCAEASIVALQAAPFVLAPGAPGKMHSSAFVATYLADHPQASSVEDLQRLAEVVRSFAGAAPLSAATELPVLGRPPRERARLLQAEDLSQAELVELFGHGHNWRHVERAADGELLSFFTDSASHVVLRAKELRVDRPHGNVMQAKCGYLPDESIMSTTAFACGVFNSHITQGNTNFNTLLSVCTNPQTPELEGQRILVQLADAAYLLGVPSAFVMGLHHCTWIYKHGEYRFQVRAWTSVTEPRINLAFNVLRGGPVRLTLSHQLDASNGWSVGQGAADEFVAKPRAGSMLAEQFPQAQFRLLVNSSGYVAREESDKLFVIEAAATAAFSVSFVGEVPGLFPARVLEDVEAQWRSDCAASVNTWRELSRGLTLRGPDEIAAIRETLPWYGLNALVHFLTPYGLEQFSGAAWGTRDVCQGPIELLLCQEKYAEVKQVLRVLFSRQNAEGGWPQWWMFDRYKSVRADSAHGDVIYWCILALCSYIKASGDFAVLDEKLPYFQGEPTTAISEHVDRIVDLIVKSFVPGTALVQFGGGDWNDSLQPVSKDLARRLISSWTVQMSYQALTEYREVCERAGHAQRAQQLSELAERILTDFQRHLVRDGIVAGYGLVGADGQIDVLLHPRDTTTGVQYSLLPMNRGVISGVFDKEQAERHLSIIAQHLTGPDGARLMDRPLRYRGGPQTIFQRAESSTYFGREIGLMYVHEHLRFAESQARLGKPAAFLKALRQAIPVDYQQIVPQGELRQANCYYSSSDVLFKRRYDADVLYADEVDGKTALKGGWRVYSSGPGIYIALIVTRLLGLRIELDELIIDPVLDASLHGLQAAMSFRGHAVTFKYHVTGQGFGPRTLKINGKPATFEREPNRYRLGGALVPLASFLAMLDAAENHVEIEL